MSEVKLLPCPFCGGDAEIDGGGFGEIFAACTKCWCHMGGAWSTTQDHAATTWNTRANLAERDAEVEALRAEVEDYRTNGAAAVRFAPSSAHWSKELRRLFGDDARTGIEVLENRHRQELARAERLAGALRWIANGPTAAGCDDGMDEVDAIKARATAALEQESNDA